VVRQRTLFNALRAHLAEFGVIAPQGLRNVVRLIAIVRDESETSLPDLARQVLEVLAAQVELTEAAVAAVEKQLMAWHGSNPVSQRLATIPGIGPIIGTALAATVVEPSGFARCRLLRQASCRTLPRLREPKPANLIRENVRRLRTALAGSRYEIVNHPTIGYELIVADAASRSPRKRPVSRRAPSHGRAVS
jgi:hypothetical protein